MDELHVYSVLEEDTGLLGKTDYMKKQRQHNGLALSTIGRGALQRRLIEFAQNAGIQIHWGYKLETLRQTDDSVKVRFANGLEETFSFVVGCDGLHSSTRGCLFGEQPANYQGIASVRFMYAHHRVRF